jgi:hypothetical protein
MSYSGNISAIHCLGWNCGRGTKCTRFDNGGWVGLAATVGRTDESRPESPVWGLVYEVHELQPEGCSDLLLTHADQRPHHVLFLPAVPGHGAELLAPATPFADCSRVGATITTEGDTGR